MSLHQLIHDLLKASNHAVYGYSVGTNTSVQKGFLIPSDQRVEGSNPSRRTILLFSVHGV